MGQNREKNQGNGWVSKQDLNLRGILKLRVVCTKKADKGEKEGGGREARVRGGKKKMYNEV